MPKVYNKHHKNAPADAVYVGRPSKWGNPHVLDSGAVSRLEVVRRYEELVESNPAMKEAIRAELRGRDLVCFCAPLACHADVLLRIANEEPPCSTSPIPSSKS